MKINIHFSKIFLLGVLGLLSPSVANALIPTLDASNVKSSVETNVNIVKQAKEIQDVKKMSGEINSSIGSVTSSISKFKSENLDKIQEKAAKIKKEKERLEEKKAQIDKIRDDIEKQKQRVEDAKAEVEDYKKQISEAKEVAGGIANEFSSVTSDVSSLANSGLNSAASSLGVSNELSSATSFVSSQTKSSSSNSSSSGVVENYDAEEDSTEDYISSDNKSYSTDEAVEASVTTVAPVRAVFSNAVVTNAVATAVETGVQASEVTGQVILNDTEEQSLSTENTNVAKISVGEVSDEVLEDVRTDENQVIKNQISETISKTNTSVTAPNRSRRVPFGLKINSDKVLQKEELKTNEKQSYRFSEELIFAQVSAVTGSTKVYDNYIDGKFALSSKFVNRCEKNAADLSDYDALKKCVADLVACTNNSNETTAVACREELDEILSDQLLSTLSNALEKKNVASTFETKVVEKVAKDAAAAKDERSDFTVNATINEEMMKVINDTNDLLAAQIILKSMEGFRDIKPSNLDVDTTSSK
ncbi:MAG: hypothetical protein ACK5N8_06965 [Alphaproteobacteria bacterium]